MKNLQAVTPRHRGKNKKQKPLQKALEGSRKRKREAALLGDDDDFGDLVVPEDPGNVHASVGGMVQLDDEADLELGPTENGHAERLKQGSKLSKKEKKALEGGLESGDAAQDAADAQQAPAKQKKIKKIKLKKSSATAFEAQRAVASGIVEAGSADQASWLHGNWTQYGHASELEADSLSETCIVQLPTSEGGFEAQLQAACADFLPEIMGHGLPAGSPAVIMISPAAMGAVKLIKKLPGLNKECKVAKLFAKHFKVEEQQKLLDSTVVGIASGTPNRLNKLANLDSLKLDRLRLLVLDVHIDAKQRTILDIPETRGDLWAFFARHVAPRLEGGNCRIALVDGEKLQ